MKEDETPMQERELYHMSLPMDIHCKGVSGSITHARQSSSGPEDRIQKYAGYGGH